MPGQAEFLAGSTARAGSRLPSVATAALWTVWKPLDLVNTALSPDNNLDKSCEWR